MKLKITLTKSTAGKNKNQIRNIEALGLKKIGSSVIHNDIPSVRGMIFKVKHMVTVEEINE